MKKNTGGKDENIANTPVSPPMNAEGGEGLEALGKTDYRRAMRGLLTPLLLTFSLTALLVVALTAFQLWAARQTGGAGSASGSLPSVMAPLTFILAAAILILLAVGAFRAGVGVRRLTRVIAEQAETHQEHIDALRHRHARLSATLAGTEDAAIAADTAGRITFLNSAAEKLTGWDEADALGREARAVLTLVNERTGAALADPAAQVQADLHRYDFPTGAVLIARGGRRYPVTGSAAPIREEGEEPSGVAIVFRDISERQKHAADIRDIATLRGASEARAVALQRDLSDHQHAVQEAETALRQERVKANTLALAESREKSALLGDVSDELRTPLNAILGYSELLQEEAEDEGLDAFIPDLLKIHGAGELLMSLVNDIRDLSRIEAGQMELYRHTFGVAAMLEEVIRAAGPRMAKNGNILQVQVGEGVVEMDADQVKIKQTLLNLLSSASGFTPGGVVLLNAGREQDERGDWITFRLTDVSGERPQAPLVSGIAPEPVGSSLSAVSSDPSDSPRFAGRGLALVMARRFCQMQGGEFTLSRESGSGAVFRLRFPFSA